MIIKNNLSTVFRIHGNKFQNLDAEMEIEALLSCMMLNRAGHNGSGFRASEKNRNKIESSMLPCANMKPGSILPLFQ